MRPKQINVYRMVHVSNLPHILQQGVVTAQHPKADPNYRNIGHPQLIIDRTRYPIPLPDAGDLGEYVPFYFGGHTPMLYIIQHGYMGVPQVPPQDLCFLVCGVQDLFASGLECVFTDRNAKLLNAQFYRDPSDLNQLNWEAIKERFWNHDPLIKDQKQAEFLVRRAVPQTLLKEIVVYNSDVQAQTQKQVLEAGHGLHVVVDEERKLYF